MRCLIIIIKSEVRPITHCLGLGHEQWRALYVSLYFYQSDTGFFSRVYNSLFCHAGGKYMSFKLSHLIGGKSLGTPSVDDKGRIAFIKSVRFLTIYVDFYWHSKSKWCYKYLDITIILLTPLILSRQLYYIFFHCKCSQMPDLIWKVRARGVLHVIETRGNSQLNKTKHASNRQSHCKTYRYAGLFKHTYIITVYTMSFALEGTVGDDKNKLF